MNTKRRSWREVLNSPPEPRERTTLNIPDISLLWPGTPLVVSEGNSDWINDLGVEQLVSRLSGDRRYQSFIRQTLSRLVVDPEVIAWRQAVMQDFMINPDLVAVIQHLLPGFSNLRHSGALLGTRKRSYLLEVSDKLAELDLYTNIVEGLSKALKGSNLRSTALLTLRESLQALLEDESFMALRAELPGLRAPLDNIGSLTIGINLDLRLQPESAVLLAINDFRLGEPVSLLERLIGSRTDELQDTGIAELHHLIKDPDQRLFSPLFQDLDRLLNAVAQPIARALTRYSRASSDTLVNLEYEFYYFASAMRFVEGLNKRGVSQVLPEILSETDCMLEISGLRNINLLMKSSDDVVPNDVAFGDQGRIAILTGPNSGGKTTYLQSVGMAQVMFQAGMPIPAEAAKMTPVDHILTHFPRLETREQGRLAEEATRLRRLFQQVTGSSLVLLNETFSSTASGEAVYLAQDILSALRSIGVRAIYATHFVELVDYIDEVRRTVNGRSDLFGLVAGVELTENGETRPTFKITPGAPLGRSYAQEIARLHGISLKQILAMQNTE